MSLKILVAEDEAITLKHLTWALAAEGYEVAGVANGLEALQRLEQGPVDLLVADIKMPGMDGLALLAEVRAKHPGTEVIIVTGFGSVESAVDAMKRGALDYVTKPYNLDELLLKVRRVAEKKRLEHDNEALKAALGLDAGHPFVGRSPAFRTIVEIIESIRDSDCTVLLTGESGVGKGLVARLIHATARGTTAHSSRSTAPSSPRSCWRASCSATKRAPSRGRSRPSAACSRSPTPGRSSSTRSRRCRRFSRRSCSR